MTSFERLEALNVEICLATGAGKGADTTREAIDRYRAMLVERASEIRKAVTEARADTPYHAGRHAFIDGIARTLLRSLIEADRGELT